MSAASEKFIRLSQLHKLRRCEQVAAVCYRAGASEIGFLLVQTRAGRWTFPKGSTEPGLTHAQAAAIEAFEEAGVHGRIEEASFACYVVRARSDTRNSTANARDLLVNAHLCQVLRLDPPQEFGRNPTWFSPGQAKRRLREGRKPDYAAEISAVIDHAVQRIGTQRNAPLRGYPSREARKDALQRVQFEAGVGIQSQMETALARYVRRDRKDAEIPANAHGGQVLRKARVLQLSAPPDAAANIPLKR